MLSGGELPDHAPREIDVWGLFRRIIARRNQRTRTFLVKPYSDRLADLPHRVVAPSRLYSFPGNCLQTPRQLVRTHVSFRSGGSVMARFVVGLACLCILPGCVITRNLPDDVSESEFRQEVRVGYRLLFGLVGGAVGFVAGGKIGYEIDRSRDLRRGCEDCGLDGILIGAPVGFVSGVVGGVFLGANFDRKAALRRVREKRTRNQPTGRGLASRLDRFPSSILSSDTFRASEYSVRWPAAYGSEVSKRLRGAPKSVGCGQLSYLIVEACHLPAGQGNRDAVD